MVLSRAFQIPLSKNFGSLSRFVGIPTACLGQPNWKPDLGELGRVCSGSEMVPIEMATSHLYSTFVYTTALFCTILAQYTFVRDGRTPTDGHSFVTTGITLFKNFAHKSFMASASALSCDCCERGYLLHLLHVEDKSEINEGPT